MSEAFSAFVSHLECSETGEQYPANQAYNVSNAGYPLLVRYNLNALRDALEPGTLSLDYRAFGAIPSYCRSGR